MTKIVTESILLFIIGCLSIFAVRGLFEAGYPVLAGALVVYLALPRIDSVIKTIL